MANVIGKRVNGNLVYVDRAAHDKRVVWATGPDVIQFEFLPWVHNLSPCVGTDPEGFVTTVVEAGCGTSDMTTSAAVGILARLTTAANDNDGISLQLTGSEFEFTSNQGLVYYGIEVDICSISTSDIFAGIAVTDTALLGGVADGVYIESLDGVTTSVGVTEKSCQETSSSNIKTLSDNTFHFLEFYFDGSSVYFFVDGTPASTIHTTNIPCDVVLTPSLEFLAGSCSISTADIRQWRAVQVGRT